MSEPLYRCIAPDVKLGQRVKIYAFTNLYGCEVGDDVKIGTFVEIQKGVRVGNRCKISSHSFLCEGVTLEEEVFIGHGVTFINDRFPKATNASGALQTEAPRLTVVGTQAQSNEEPRLVLGQRFFVESL